MTRPIIAGPADTWTATGPAPTRIAHFTDTYLPRRDGVVTSLRTLCNEQRAAGCETVTVAPRHRAQPEDPYLMALRAVPCGVADLRVGWPTRRRVDRVAAWGPDLVHVHTPGPMGLLGTVVARRLGVPLVHTYHTDLAAYADAYRVPPRALEFSRNLYARRLGAADGDAVRALPDPGGEDHGSAPGDPDRDARASRRGAAVADLHRLLLGDADAVVVPTPSVLARTDLPVPTERIFLVPAGVAPRPATAQDAAAFRRRHGLPAGDPVVLFVGRVNREKGVDLLISAFREVLRQVPRARLVLVGAVYETRWLSGLLDDAGVAARTVLTGQLPPDQVAAAYAVSQAFAFPSLTDTQGLVLQEAALAGLPCLLADARLHRTGVLGDAALLADPDPVRYGAALASLLADPVAAHAAGQSALQRALRHTPAGYAASMRRVYVGAVRSRATAGR